MTIKNITGATYTFKIGKRSFVLADQATTVADEDTVAIQDAVREANAGNIQIITEPSIVQLAQYFAGTPAREGYVAVDLNTVVDGNTITIAGEVFEFDSNSTVSGSNTPIDIATGSPSHAVIAARLQTAVNADTVLQGIGLVAGEILTITSTNAKLILKATNPNHLIGSITISKSGSPITLATAVAASASVAYKQSISNTTAAGTTMLINTGLTTITTYVISVVSSAGVVKNYDGTVVASGGFLYLNAAGAVDLASGDVVTVIAQGV